MEAMVSYTCPSCGVGGVHATFQTYATWPAGTIDGWGVPDSDSFVSASCDNAACAYSLEQEPGDGRLRRAILCEEDAVGFSEPVEPGTLVDVEDAWISTVERIVADADGA
jgi:hypothetical protein